MMKLSVIVPVYNEEQTVTTVIDAVMTQKLPADIERELIIVDDGSTDDTPEKIHTADDPRIRLYRHRKNRGKGAALSTGIKHAEGDFIIFQDADLEYTPGDYPALLGPILENTADVVFGSRFLLRDNHFLSPWNRMANRLLTGFSNLFSGMPLTDMETCYKLFKTEVIQSLCIKEKRFGVEPEITAKTAALYRTGTVRITEVPITYRPRGYADGKKIGIRDGLTALYAVVKYNVMKS